MARSFQICVRVPDVLAKRLARESNRRRLTLPQTLLALAADQMGIEYSPRTRGRLSEGKEKS